MLPAERALADALAPAATSPDPLVRAAVLDVLRALSLGEPDLYRAALDDPDARVRLQAVRGLVGHDDRDGLVAAASDSERGRSGSRRRSASGDSVTPTPMPRRHLVALAGDQELLVRAAALEAAAGVGGELRARGPVPSSDCRIRPGRCAPERPAGSPAATAEIAVPALLTAAVDPHLDVRKAAVIALAGWTGRQDVRDTLEVATKDSDADVRGYARRQLARGR